MISGLRRRVSALEDRIGGEAVRLTMTDGSIRSVRSDMRHWRRLHDAWSQRTQAEFDDEPEPANPLMVELNAIRDAVTIDEEGDCFGLLRCLLQGPNETEEVSCPVPIR